MNKFEKGHSVPMGRPRDEVRAYMVEALTGRKPVTEIIAGIHEGFGIKEEDMKIEKGRIRIKESALGQLDKMEI